MRRGERDAWQQLLFLFLTFLCCRSPSLLKFYYDALCRYVDRLPFDAAAVRNGPCTCSLWTGATSGATSAVQSGCSQLRRPRHSGNTTQTRPEESERLAGIFFYEGSKAKKVENHWCNLWRCIVICYECWALIWRVEKVAVGKIRQSKKHCPCEREEESSRTKTILE